MGWQDAPVVSGGGGAWEAAPAASSPTYGSREAYEAERARLKALAESSKAERAARTQELTARAEGAITSVPADQSRFGGVATSGMEGVGAGYGDELRGHEAAVLGETPQGGMFDYSQPYDYRRFRAEEAQKVQREGFEQAHPYQALAAEVGGALLSGGAASKAGLTLARAAGAAPSAARAGAIAGAEGAAYGGLYGSGKAEEGQRLQGAKEGALLGGVAGGALGAAGQGIANAISQRAANKAAPTVEKLKKVAGDLYKQAEDQGVLYGRPAWAAMVNDVKTTLQKYAYDADNAPKVAQMLRKLEKLDGNANAVTLEHVRGVIQYLNETRQTVDPLTGGKSKMLLSQIRDRLEKFIEDPRAIIGAQGDAKLAVGAVRQANMLWRNAKKGETLKRLIDEAERETGATWSGGNINNKLRQKFEKLLKRIETGKEMGWSKQEVDAIKELVLGGSRTLRWISKMSPEGSGLMAILQLGGLAASGGMSVGTLIPPMAIKKGLDAQKRLQAATMSARVRGRGIPMAQPPAPALAGPRANVARALAGQAGANADQLPDWVPMP